MDYGVDVVKCVDVVNMTDSCEGIRIDYRLWYVLSRFLRLSASGSYHYVKASLRSIL